MEVRYISEFHYFSRSHCVVCGQLFEIETEQPFAFDSKGAEIGLLCAHCADAEVTELRRRLSTQSVTLHRHAHTLEQIAREPIVGGSRRLDAATVV